MKKTERDLGVKLFERSGNRYVATTIGRVFLKHASEVLDAEARLLSSMKHAREATSGRLQIATSAVISTVESGAGISLVSSWAERGPLSEGRIGCINVPRLRASRRFNLVNAKGHTFTAPAGIFRDFVLGRRDYLKKHYKSEYGYS